MKSPTGSARLLAKPMLHRPEIHFNWFDYLMIPLFLLAEIGISYWMAFPTLFSAYTAYKWRRVIAAGLNGVPTFLFVAPLLFICLFIEDGTDFAQDLLRIARQAIFWVLLLAIFRGIPHFRIIVSDKLIKRISIPFSIVLMVLAAWQAYKFKQGIYFGIPVDYYSQGKQTIPDDLDLAYSALRPAATFAEPSYFAYILVSLMFITRSFSRPGGLSYIATLFYVISGILSQSLSFILCASGMFVVGVYTSPAFARYRSRITLIASIGGMLLLVGGAAYFSDSRIARFGNASGDISAFTRIFGPALALPSYMLNHPFGVPFSTLYDALEPYTSQYGLAGGEYTVNQFFNVLFDFGFNGAFVLYFLFRGQTPLSITLLMGTMFFNGTMFAPDKFYVLTYTYLIVAGLDMSAASAVGKVPLRKH